MKTEELSSLIKSTQLERAEQGLRNEGCRLSRASASSPMLDVIRAYGATKEGYSWRFSAYAALSRNNDEGEKLAIRASLLNVFRAMLDAGADPKFYFSRLGSWSNDQEEAAHAGIYTGARPGSPFDVSDYGLYARLAGFGWTQAMEVLHERGEAPTGSDLFHALLNAVARQQPDAVQFILDKHPELPRAKSYEELNLMPMLMRWEDAPTSIIARLEEVYNEDPGTWMRPAIGIVRERSPYSSSSGTDIIPHSHTFLRWLDENPSKWDDVHRKFDEKGSSNYTRATLWPVLAREFVRTGQYENLVKHALSRPDFPEIATKQALPGQSNQPPPPPLASWFLTAPLYKVPTDAKPGQAFGALRRQVKLVRMALGHGASLRFPKNGDAPEIVDSMELSRLGRSPTRATVHRHPQLLALSADGSGPVHTAKDLDTAKAWEAVGASISPNNNNEDPWVVGLENTEAPAPWAREIAARIKAGLLPLDARGKELSLEQVSLRSPPLARFWMARSKLKIPSEDMVKAAVHFNQWGVFREWMQEGKLEKNKKLRQAALDGLCPPLDRRKTTPSMEQAWKDCRGELAKVGPWPEFVDAWRLVFNAGRLTMLDTQLIQALSRWPGDPRTYWTQEDEDLLFSPHHCGRLGKQLLSICPVEILPQEVARMGWKALLEGEESSRVENFNKLRCVFDDIPLSLGGEEMFGKWDEWASSDLGEVYIDRDSEMVALVEKERLHMATAQASPPKGTITRRI